MAASKYLFLVFASLAVLPTASGAAENTKSAEPEVVLTVPATTRTEAMDKARIGAGRIEPFDQVSSSKDFPFAHRHQSLEAEPKKSTKVRLPPPPTELVPPPPPQTVPGGMLSNSQEALKEVELPEPPEKPELVNKLKLVGIIGDKAVFTFTDPELRRANKWPAALILATGEEFESVHVVSVDNNKVVLDEDSQRTSKELERIR